ncbi:flagellar hook-associated protein 3 FlgL [Hathewaya proteolytica DSM 3090]|uniref:Flagellar hook-associated protein 3 FlgL n=1 Tax=Hathewaya proteolytica DSM 3090 TaxID=1121331 RepID=A0A1M6LBU3_9CLOT|nr:flagellar hook-associated protein FlgL [Hathewaya proteolytica]SHJ68629.1 flagellar hook-associated protein 3 FlgL [Hathewaya proteolytica DSM 3090]
MRITNKMLATSFLSDMNRNLNHLQTLQQQMTSGKEVRLPSDDPFKVARAMQLHTDISTNKQYNKNIEDAINFLDVTDTALNQTTQMMQRVNELLVSAGNAGYGSSERRAIKDEINQKISELSQILNTSFDGKYIFSGTSGTTKPIKTIGGISYNNAASIKFSDDKDEIAKWKNVKLSIDNPLDPTKKIEVDLKALNDKPTLDDIAAEINKSISEQYEKDDLRVVTNNKDRKLLFINETGKELNISVTSNAGGGPIPNSVNDIKSITTSVKVDNGNTEIMYNTEDGQPNKILSESLLVEISQGVTIGYNVTATDVLSFRDKNGDSKDFRQLLKSITNHLDGKDSNGNEIDEKAVEKLLTEDLSELKSAMENVLRVRAEVGAKQNRMDSAKEKNIEQNFNLTEILSKTEDIDITEKTMEYAVLQSVYLASLQTSAKVLQPTLMDYMR